jgi:hypothetical protein
VTDPVTPATDKEVEQARRDASPQGILGALIARIDAERARAERLLNDLSEAALREANDFIQRLVEMNKDAKALHTHALRVAADNAALRGEVADAREWMKGGERWNEVQTSIRATAAKITEVEAERDAERAALAESEAVRDRMRALLDAVAVAVRGPPAPNALHDHARLPDEVAALRAERLAERAARERAEAALAKAEDANGVAAMYDAIDAEDERDEWKARAERAEADADGWRDWVETLTDKLDEALAGLRWDNHDNWCPRAMDAFLPYKKNPKAPPACSCWVSDSWAKVEGARAALSQEKEGGK